MRTGKSETRDMEGAREMMVSGRIEASGSSSVGAMVSGGEEMKVSGSADPPVDSAGIVCPVCASSVTVSSDSSGQVVSVGHQAGGGADPSTGKLDGDSGRAGIGGRFSPPPPIEVPPKLYRIGEVVEHSGLSRQTVHNYTMMGLLVEVRRTEGGHRLYDEWYSSVSAAFWP